MTVEMLAQITAEASDKNSQGFCCGIVLWDDIVIETAPRVYYMKGWTRAHVRMYCHDRGWKVSVVWEIERRDIDAKGRSKRELE